MAAMDENVSPKALRKGVAKIERQLRQALSKVQVERIDSLGKPFDPEHHEALTTIESEEHEEGTSPSDCP